MELTESTKTQSNKLQTPSARQLEQRLDTTIKGIYLAVDRARESALDRRAARQALDELGDNASFNSLHDRAFEIREELRKTEAL